MSTLKNLVESYMQKVSGLKEHCNRCLRTERWGSSVVLMVVDAAFTSIGLNYFTAVVPKVEEFRKRFVESGKIKNLKELAKANINDLRNVWKNRRSWIIAKEIASYLSTLSDDDKTALRTWAKNANLEKWEEDPIGKINGVGLITFQYLRMMGGIDTVMPDKIVKRVINEILEKAGFEPVNDDIEFIKRAEEIALICRYRPIELCWMTWLIQPEGKMMRMEKYSKILPKI
jgi:polyhydroxyalkanoate synthesis regulator phasin